MSVRLLINEGAIFGTRPGGIPRYFRNIAQAAAMRYGGGLTVCSSERLTASPARWIHSPRFRGAGRLHLNDMVVTIAAALLRPRLYHGIYYGNVRTRAPQVFTVYDMIHELYAPKSPEGLLRNFIEEKRRCMERAAALLAISHSTAADIVRLYPHIDASKIAVTHLGVDDHFFVEAPPRQAERPYFMFVGIRDSRKNFLRLVEAYTLAGVGDAFDLLVVSTPATFTAEESALMERCRVASGVKLISRVTDAELAKLYAGSAALLFPTEYEGFGLPVLEALAAGTLVVTSSTSSLPEVGGEAAIYCDPRDLHSMTKAIRLIANLSMDERRERRARGIEWARTFTWSRCAAQTIEVFDRLLS